MINQVFRLASQGSNLRGLHDDDGERREQALRRGQGIHQYRVNGEMVHNMGAMSPPNGKHIFSQLYMLDVDAATQARLNNNESTKAKLLEYISQSNLAMLHNLLTCHHSYAALYSNIWEQIKNHEVVPNFTLTIKDTASPRVVIQGIALDPRVFSAPAAQGEIAAAVVLNAQGEAGAGRDLRVKFKGDAANNPGGIVCINEKAPMVDTLNYPLLLPYGQHTWREGMRKANGKKLTLLEYYNFMIQQRDGYSNFLLRADKLMQEFMVSAALRVEFDRLNFFRNPVNQAAIRADLYQREDHHNAQDGEDQVAIGNRIILPSSFIGGPRFMHGLFQDSIAIARVHGMPTLFITMTCNPKWKEITENLLPGQTADCNPELCCRVFKNKLEQLLKDIDTNQFGKCTARVYTIEYQKRGLPHAHIIVWLDACCQLMTPADKDVKTMRLSFNIGQIICLKLETALHEEKVV
jgi:Helitron helicase-like domain at N-terminus